MRTNVLKDRVQIQLKTTTLTAGGETEVWSPVQTCFARVIPLDAKAIAQYQQLESQVSHRIVFGSALSIGLGTHRFVHGAKTYIPSLPPQVINGQTVVVVKEV